MKCAECKTETERPKYCSPECQREGNRKLNQSRYYRINGYYQMHHRRNRDCLGCQVEYDARSVYQMFCTKECAVAHRNSGETRAEAVVENRKLELQSTDGRIHRRSAMVTLVAGYPTVVQRGKLRRPFIIRPTTTLAEKAWEELTEMLLRAKTNGQTEQFSRYVMNLSGQ